MIENDLADASGDEQETGIQVDLDSEDPAKAVVRERAKAVGPKPRTWGEERADTSKAVKKRLASIQRSFDQRLAEQQAEFQRQLAERDKRIDTFARGGDQSTDLDKSHEAAMEKFQADLEEAQERGDSKAVAKITAEMTRAEGKYWAQKAAGQGVTDKTNDRTAPTAQTTQTAKPTKAGVAWAKANGEWWNDTVDDTATDARAFANRLHARKLADGDDPEDPAYFEAIGAAVRKRFPELEVKSVARRQDEDDDGIHRNPRREAPPQIRDRGEAPPSSRQMQTLTKADIATMRQVGMNPDDNKHVVQFLRSKNEVDAESA